jgi:serine protease Do
MIARKWQRRLTRVAVAPTLVGAGALIALGLKGHTEPQNSVPPISPTAQVLGVQDDFEKVAEKLRPSVVSIKSRQTISGPMMRMGADQGQENPFGGFQFQFPGAPGGGQQFRGMQPGVRHAMASGSGVIVRSDGYILTNDHVVADADRVTVTLLDGREFTGKVFRDPKSDLALIKIDADNLPAAQLADSDGVRIGQWALAFGSPFALNDTMTVGVVSSLNRREEIGEGGTNRLYPSLIQTDASINPGNSGGPLVDVYGRVVGINVAIESPSGGNVGIGFAIPANTARYIMDQLISKGSVTRGFLGLAPATLSFEDAQRYGVKQGALVTSVQDGTPAAQAGFQVEDVVVRFDNKPVAGEASFRDMVARTAPGTTVPVVVERNGKETTLNVTVGQQPQVKQVAQDDQAPARDRAKGKLGVEVGNLDNAQLRQQFNLKDTIKSGAVVAEVVPGMPAQQAGLMAGDVIVRLDGKPIENAEQLSEVANGLKPGASVPVVIRRTDGQGTTQTILGTINLD